tara:strand:- start:553 stop:789 length:237 start_codon:yes stop_codon:yes gene_type:complete
MIDHVQEIKCALYNHAQGQIAKHKTNVMLMMERSVGVGEHSSIVETIEEELNKIAKYQDQLTVLNKYFPNNKIMEGMK